MQYQTTWGHNLEVALKHCHTTGFHNREFVPSLHS